jgi:hypothetical protein
VISSRTIVEMASTGDIFVSFAAAPFVVDDDSALITGRALMPAGSRRSSPKEVADAPHDLQ